MELSVTVITPSLAKKFLEKNTRNRPVTRRHVDNLAKEMSEGNWVTNGETICFDIDGTLLDGQHRLMAVIESGCTVFMAVARGVDDDRAFKTYDTTQSKRGAKDIAAILGVKESTNVTAIARILMKYDQEGSTSDVASAANTGKFFYSAHQIAEKAAYIAEDAYAAIRKTSNIAAIGGHKAATTALYMLFSRADKELADDFFGMLNDGIFTSKDHPCKRLFDFLVSSETKRHFSITRRNFVGMYIKAWNAYTEGRNVKQLKFTDFEDVPEINLM